MTKIETVFDGKIGFSFDKWGDIKGERHRWRIPWDDMDDQLSDDTVVLTVWRPISTGPLVIFGAYKLEQLVVALTLHNEHSANLYAGQLALYFDQWLKGE